MLNLLYLFSLGIIGSFVEATPRATCESFTCDTNTHIPKLPKANFSCAGETCCDSPVCASVNVQEETCGAKGHSTIIEQDDCEAIAIANNKSMITLNFYYLPQGCFNWPDYAEDSYIFNPNEESTIECASDTQCICLNFEDIDSCCIARATCDTATCGASFSLIDDASSTYCENTTCTEEADFDSCCEANESCENFECNPQTLLSKQTANFCKGHCGTRNSTVKINEGTCVISGHYPVKTLYGCQKIAENHGRVFRGREYRSNYPAGCYFFGKNSVYLNENFDSSSDCNGPNLSGCQCLSFGAHACCTQASGACNMYTCSNENKTIKDEYALCGSGGCSDDICCVDRDTCDSFSCDLETHVPQMPAANFLCAGASCMNHSRVTSFTGVNTTNCIELGYGFADLIECETLADDANRYYAGVLNDTEWPSGCFFHGDSAAAYNVYVNEDISCGAANATCQCKTLVDSQDAKACCKARAKCSSYTCNPEGGYVPVESHWQNFCANTICKQNEPACCDYVPPCRYTSGIYENDERCFCGDQMCSKKLNQRYCDITTQTCSTSRGCTPPLKEKNSANDTSKKGCEGSFESVTLSSLYARIGAKELCLSYDSEGWASIEDERICKQVADVFEHPFKVHKTSGYGCSLDEDGILYFGRGVEESVVVNYCMRK